MTSKSNADKAYDQIEPFKRTGRYARYYQVQCGWNHAALKQAIVQSTIGSPQFVIIFTGSPDAEMLGRIKKQGFQAFSLPRFAGILRLQLDIEKAQQP